MCTCAREGRVAAAASKAADPSSAAQSAPARTVAMTFTGHRARLVRGPITGTGYAGYPNESVQAHPDDAAGLVASGFFVAAP